MPISHIQTLLRALAAVAAVTCVGCLERSTVVKVKKDGSGIVHIRQFEQKPVISIGGSKVRDDESGESVVPSQDGLEKLAETMGGDVELVSATESINRNGWKGYELVYRFSDINKLVITDEMSAKDSSQDDAEMSDSELSETASNKDAADKPKSGFRFSMNNEELKIHSLIPDAPDDAQEAEPGIGAVDPFAGEPAGPASIDITVSAMDKIMMAALADMRIGIFVQVDGEIASTNARHRTDNLITLLRADVGKILESPNAKQHMHALKGVEGASDRRQRTAEIAEQIDGLDFDAQDPIVVRMR